MRRDQPATQEDWIEEALARGREPMSPDASTHLLDALHHLDTEGLREYNLRRLRESTVAGGPSPAILNRVPVRQDRPAKVRETS